MENPQKEREHEASDVQQDKNRNIDQRQSSNVNNPSRYNRHDSHVTVSSDVRTSERFPESGVIRDQTNLHSQRGPEGYRRSDERIRDIITDLISDDQQINDADFDVRVHEAHVRVTGYVPDEESRQRVQDVIDRVPGIRHVDNELKVNPHAHDTEE